MDGPPPRAYADAYEMVRLEAIRIARRACRGVDASEREELAQDCAAATARCLPSVDAREVETRDNEGVRTYLSLSLSRAATDWCDARTKRRKTEAAFAGAQPEPDQPHEAVEHRLDGLPPDSPLVGEAVKIARELADSLDRRSQSGSKGGLRRSLDEQVAMLLDGRGMGNWLPPGLNAEGARRASAARHTAHYQCRRAIEKEVRARARGPAGAPGSLSEREAKLVLGLLEILCRRRVTGEIEP